MTTHSESSTSQDPLNEQKRLPAWLKVGAVAAASAIAGGLAAAWFYRKTLTRLQSAENEHRNTEFGIGQSDGDEEA